jgi:hypothetical protein
MNCTKKTLNMYCDASARVLRVPYTEHGNNDDASMVLVSAQNCPLFVNVTKVLWWDITGIDKCLTAELTATTGDFGVLAILVGNNCNELSCIKDSVSNEVEVGWRALKEKKQYVAYGIYNYLIGGDFDFRLKVRFAAYCPSDQYHLLNPFTGSG